MKNETILATLAALILIFAAGCNPRSTSSAVATPPPDATPEPQLSAEDRELALRAETDAQAVAADDILKGAGVPSVAALDRKAEYAYDHNNGVSKAQRDAYLAAFKKGYAAAYKELAARVEAATKPAF